MVRLDDAATFDWTSPDYGAVLTAREERLMRLRADPQLLAEAHAYYAEDPASFIHDWGMTSDPRVVGAGRSATMPLLLFPRQRELVNFLVDCWRKASPGVVEKSRDCGASVLSMALAATLCLFHRGITVGVGSRKEESCDLSGSPDTLLYKARFFIRHLPREFRGGWDVRKHSAHMRLAFPSTGSAIVAEAGDAIGRGGRSSLFLLDEAAHVERPKLIDAALLANTDARVDLSSVNGMNNSFAERRHGGKIPVFTFHYRDDPRKDAAWVEKKRAETDEATWNAEYELDYLSSVPGVLIKPEWVRASIDAHIKLGIEPMGAKSGALDPADEGSDLCAFGARHGIVVTHVETWSGKGSDLHQSTEKTFELCDQLALKEFIYDGDGLGAGVRAAANQISARRRERKQRHVGVQMYRGSAAVLRPDQNAPGTDVKNKDRFYNLKAQQGFTLRDKFEATYRAVNGAKVDPEKIISLSSSIKELSQLCVELSLPVWRTAPSGRIVIEKYGAEGTAASPNCYDVVLMLMGAPLNPPMRVSAEVLAALDRPEPNYPQFNFYDGRFL